MKWETHKYFSPSNILHTCCLRAPLGQSRTKSLYLQWQQNLLAAIKIDHNKISGFTANPERALQ